MKSMNFIYIYWRFQNFWNSESLEISGFLDFRSSGFLKFHGCWGLKDVCSSGWMSGFQVVDYGIRDSGILGTGKRVSSSWGSRRLGLKMGGGSKRVEDGLKMGGRWKMGW